MRSRLLLPFALSLFTAAGLLAASCSDDTETSPTSSGPPPATTIGAGYLDTDCDPIDPTQCGFPYPSNVYLKDDSSTKTGKSIAFGATTLPKVKQAKHMDPSFYTKYDGFSPGSTILAHFPNATIEGFANEDTLEQSVTTDSPTILLDAETGELVPHIAELDTTYSRLTESVAEDDDQALMIRPVVRLKDAHRYVVAIRRVKNTDGKVIDPSPAFKALRDGTAFADDKSVERRRDLYKDIFAKLDTAGIKKDDLQLAWDFSTSSKDNHTAWMIHMRDTALAAVGEDGPTYTITSSVDNPNEHIARRIEGKMKVPLFLSDAGPDGELVIDPATNLPKQNGEGEFEFIVQIPNSATKKPAPLLQNGHGLLGSRNEGRDGYLAEMADFKNYVTISVNFTGFAEEDLDGVQTVLVGDPGKFEKYTGRQHQGVINSLLAMRMLKGRFVKEPLAQFDMNGEMKSALDPSQGCFYRGDSQGGIYGGTYMAVSTDVTRGLLGEPGAPYSLLLNRSKDFGPFFFVLQNTMSTAKGIQMALAMVQLHWDRSEPIGYIPYINDDLLPNTPKHEILIHAAIGDQQVTTLGAHIIARSVKAKNVAPVNRSIYDIPEATPPFDGSAIVEFSFGLPKVPIENRPPTQGEDPHDSVRSLDAAYAQSDTFFRTGQIVTTCDGPCDPE
ncbi:MAG: hypothetical protein U0165_15080 [Polyangiaceae bacterium]